MSTELEGRIAALEQRQDDVEESVEAFAMALQVFLVEYGLQLGSRAPDGTAWLGEVVGAIHRRIDSQEQLRQPDCSPRAPEMARRVVDRVAAHLKLALELERQR
ncbi:hypothetical protein [Rhodoplanes roseus]|uniref:Uncharacterized protein n=1 Tax=Rhodoplanes roseus TaxID=29409 RepID=A0A327KML6_9BRAD|nr:hypothetical protein [Rhodoplanes roseus]RAI40130.1 hypothetical protein CH341_24410 [Rhodoplanes roseus]